MKSNRLGNLGKWKYYLRFVVVLIILIMIFQPNFSSNNYTFIPQKDIPNELLKLVHQNIVNMKLPLCKYKIIENGALIDVSKAKTKLKIDDTDIISGEYYPKNCRPLYSTAILVPHRNRTSQLEIFLPYIHNFLRNQEIHYRIFVIHQGDSTPWNKGKLFNVGALIAKEYGFQCLVLHDVDMLPLHQTNMFACTSHPRHMSPCIDKFRYNLIYKELVGGALAITFENYMKINGYSNKFEMWGGEDDEFSNRIFSENFQIHRFSPNISKYTMMIHKQEPKNNKRHQIIKENRDKYKEDGLNSVTYKKVSISHNPLYTNVTVEL